MHQPDHPAAPTDNPVEGALRVYWIPQVPMTSFIVDVPNLYTASVLLDTLANYDAFQLTHNIKPDYSNAGGLMIFEDGEWFEWQSEEGDDFDEYRERVTLEAPADYTPDTIGSCLGFFQKIIPNPEEKNFSTQLGVHFEEVREMIQELVGTDETTTTILLEADQALHRLSQHLKQTLHSVSINRRLEYLDALCDQVVTATGCAHMAGMDIVGAMHEVNSSNESKLVNGRAIFDPDSKFQKGPDYRKADLNRFV